MPLQKNTLFADRYRLLEFIGRGGFSEVWLADDTKAGGMQVALKVYAPGTGLDEDSVQLFSQEFSLVFNLNHSHLLRPSHFDVCDRMPYLIMPFCEKGPAAKLIGKITEEQAWKFLHDVAAGLAYLHEQESPVIHQDIKPDNVLINSNGNYLITDFGISAKARSTLRKSVVDSNKNKKTPAYTSPERFSKDNMPIKAGDVWALGATLYEILTGDVPFGELGGLVQKSGAEIPTIKANYSSELKEIVTSCLQKEPWDRPTAEKIVEWSEKHLKGKLIKKENGIMKYVGIACGLIVCFITLFAVWHNYNHKNYESNVIIANNFYSTAQYEDAQNFYDTALKYVKTDSIIQKKDMLNALIPAMKDFYNAQYKSAFEQFELAAQLGSGDAYYYMGELTYNGLGTIKDYNKGWEYTQKAAEKGFKMAYWRIANAYETGKGVPKDKDKADSYYLEAIEAMKKLAESGDPEAIANLGSMYSSGSGVAKNPKFAFEYSLKASEKGYAFVMTNLANCYRYGNGTELNNEEAVKWYSKSADMGNPFALLTLGNCYLDGFLGLTKNSNKGIELIEKAAEQNYSEALSKLGYLYWKGEIVTENKTKSFEYTKRAVLFDNDNVIAIENLAFDYKTGSGTDKDYSAAKDYYLQAVKADSTRTADYIYIAKLYYEGGYGLEKDEDEYVRYLELAEEKGNSTGRSELGDYYNHLGFVAYNAKKYKEAKAYFKKAIAKGNTWAETNLVILKLLDD